MINAAKQMFKALESLFKAAEHSANALSNCAEWADESSAAFRDKAREERKQQLIKMETQTAKLEQKQQAQLEA